MVEIRFKKYGWWVVWYEFWGKEDGDVWEKCTTRRDDQVVLE